MNRVYFNAGSFKKFMDATYHNNWPDSFRIMGFKTYEYNRAFNPGHSLSPEEYTWFLLRWS